MLPVDELNLFIANIMTPITGIAVSYASLSTSAFILVVALTAIVVASKQALAICGAFHLLTITKTDNEQIERGRNATNRRAFRTE